MDLMGEEEEEEKIIKLENFQTDLNNLRNEIFLFYYSSITNRKNVI